MEKHYRFNRNLFFVMMLTLILSATIVWADPLLSKTPPAAKTASTAPAVADALQNLPPAGQIRANSVGEGGLEMNDGFGWTKVANGLLLPINNSTGVQFRTMSVESSFDYPDGRTISLKIGTDITIFSDEEELSLNKGGIKISSGGAAPNFKVTTAGGVFIQETGTIYSVVFDSLTKETTVEVEEGGVNVKMIGQAAATALVAGEKKVFSEVADTEPEAQAALSEPAPAVELVAANVEALSPTAVAGEGQINVQSATYGGNCGATSGNVTNQAKNVCNGQTSCSYQISTKVLGDPARNCAKDYAIHWTCGTNSPTYGLTAAAEAGMGSMVTLACPPPSDAKIVSPAAAVAVPIAPNAVDRKAATTVKNKNP